MKKPFALRGIGSVLILLLIASFGMLPAAAAQEPPAAAPCSITELNVTSVGYNSKGYVLDIGLMCQTDDAEFALYLFEKPEPSQQQDPQQQQQQDPQQQEPRQDSLPAFENGAFVDCEPVATFDEDNLDDKTGLYRVDTILPDAEDAAEYQAAVVNVTEGDYALCDVTLEQQFTLTVTPENAKVLPDDEGLTVTVTLESPAGPYDAGEGDGAFAGTTLTFSLLEGEETTTLGTAQMGDTGVVQTTIPMTNITPGVQTLVISSQDFDGKGQTTFTRMTDSTLTLSPASVTAAAGDTIEITATLSAGAYAAGGKLSYTFNSVSSTVEVGSDGTAVFTLDTDCIAAGTTLTVPVSYASNGVVSACRTDLPLSVGSAELTAEAFEILFGEDAVLPSSETVEVFYTGAPIAVSASAKPASTASGRPEVKLYYTLQGGSQETTDQPPTGLGSYTVTATTNGTGGYKNQTVTLGTLTVVTPITDSTRYKCQLSTLSSVPVSLRNSYASIAMMKTAMLTKLGYTAEDGDCVLYNLKLLYTNDVGADAVWSDLPAEIFPATGVKVTIPYPDGTDSGITIRVAHLFGEDNGSYKLGDMETPTVTNTEDGVSFVVSGTSPVLLAWEKSVSPSPSPSASPSPSPSASPSPSPSAAPSSRTTDDSSDSSKSKSSGSTSDDNEKDDASDEISADTGDRFRPVFWISMLAIGVIGVVGLTVYGIRRKKD